VLICGSDNGFALRNCLNHKGQLLDVISVEVLPEYKLLCTFENGEVRLFDMTRYLDIKPFNKLKNSPLFKLAKIEYGTVVWPGEIDIAPETLFIESVLHQTTTKKSCLTITRFQLLTFVSISSYPVNPFIQTIQILIVFAEGCISP
jgi:hypothetical protein